MRLQFLGTGAGQPSKVRNVSSLALKLLDERNEVWLFDCGEGTQHQILKTNLRPRKVTMIYISHLHGDHIFGLPGFLSSRSFQGGEGVPLTIYGPQGIANFVQTALKVSRTKLNYPLKFVELDPQGGSIDLDRGWQVDYLPLHHGILSFGFRITEPDYKGELLVDKLQAYNIPNGPIFGQLKRGEEVVLADGSRLNGKDFVGPDRKGRVVAILGDTRFCQNAAILAKDAHALVHEATYEAVEADMAFKHGHSTNVQAAQIAKENGVGQLLLNHISARYLGSELKRLESQTQAIFADSKIVFDLEEIEIH